MDNRTDVLIVSAYGRGHWLAVDLASKYFSVLLVDITQSMGRWAPDDWENPFGYFRMDGFESHQVARLIEDTPIERNDNGFCVWFKNGIIETQGALNIYQIDAAGISPESKDYLYKSTNKNIAVDSLLFKKVETQDFKKSWLPRLAHSLSSNIQCEAMESLEFGHPLSLFSEHSLRRVSRESLNKSLQWCKKNGVRILEEAKIKDIFLEGRTIGGAELSAQTSGIMRSKYMIWALSSEETQRLPASVSNILYPRGFVTSSWTWTRYRLKFSSDYFSDNLPSHFVVIEDLFCPWSGINTCVVQKTVNKNQFDVWLKIPTSQRFLKSYIESVGDDLISVFQARLPGCEVKIENFPQDYHYDYSEMGSSPMPVYSEDELSQLNPQRIKNFYFDGPEYWKNLDWSGQFRHQETIRNSIILEREREQKKEK